MDGDGVRTGLAAMAPGPELAALLHAVDLAAVPNAEVVEVLRASWRQVSHAYATYLAAMVEVGRAVPFAADDPHAGAQAHRLAGAGDFSTAEIGAALTFTRRRADAEFAVAGTLVGRLPLVFAALSAGEIDHHKARVFVEYLGELTDPQIERICLRLLPGAPRWTTGQLAHRLLREIHAIDPSWARRRYQRAVHERGVNGYLAPDGSATITAHGLTPSEAAAAAERLEELAAAVRRAGHPATVHQLRADLFVRLLDGRFNGFSRQQIITAMLAEAVEDTGAPVPAEPGPRHGIEVRVGLTTLLGTDDDPAELPGWGPILAEDARLLVARQHRAEWRFAVTDDTGHLVHGGLVRRRPWRASDGAPCRGGVVEIHESAALLAELERSADLPTGWRAVVDDMARQYASRDHDARLLDARPRSRFARAALRRHVQMRDRTCVAPGCRRPARKADQDHTLEHRYGGRSIRANVGPLCDFHHAMKHEGGWELQQPEPGRFRWRSPLGQIYCTRGEPIAPDLPDPVPRADDGEDDTGRCRATREPPDRVRPKTAPAELDDLPPF
jgi:hypothetical protein